MGRFSGKIGFVETVETSPGIYEPVATERPYHGDFIVRRTRLDTNSNSTNDDLTISNDISIVADKFAKEHLGYMRYVILHGQKWKITAASIEYPRIRLTVGGLYNEST